MSMKAPTDCSARGTHANRRREAWILAHPAKAYMRAFSLIELLVVVAIIAVLAAMIFPAISRMQQSAWEAGCLSNIRQLLVSTQLLATDNGGKFPWMGYPAWAPPGAPNMKTILKPYTGTNKQNSDWVGPGLLCPAAMHNNKQPMWVTNRWWPHYRYNEWYATNSLPQYKYSDAVLFFDVTFNDWDPSVCAHFPGPQARVNIGYADGHVASMPQTTYKKVGKSTNPTNSSDYEADLYKNGWITNLSN